MRLEALRTQLDRALAGRLRGDPPLDPRFVEIASTLYDEEASPRPKRLRPILAMLGAGIGGADPEEVIEVALALEMIHDYSVVLDDFMDDDRLRRGRPTAWVQFGALPAITAGCGLYTLAVQTCLDWVAASPGSASHRTMAVRRIMTAAMELHDAQLADLAAEDCFEIGPDEALSIATGRSILIGSALAIGADAAGASQNVVESLNQLSPCLSCAYSLIDDVRSFAAVDAAAGKEPGGDIRQRKKTFPIVLALQQLTTSERQAVRTLWQREARLSDAEVNEIRRRLNATDAVPATHAVITSLLEQVRTELKNVCTEQNREALAALLKMLERHFDTGIQMSLQGGAPHPVREVA